MTSRSHIENTIRSAYTARVRGDLEGTLKDFADDVEFRLNARGLGSPFGDPAIGRAAVKAVIGQLIGDWRFDDWKELSLTIDGDQACLHWTARVTFVPTGKSETFDVFDVIRFRDGKIVDFRQSTDTAQLVSLVS